MSGGSFLLPGDAGWAEDRILLAGLSGLNTAIARYVLRQLDVDAQQAEPISVDEEQALGQRLVELGERIQRRAAQHEGRATQASD